MRKSVGNVWQLPGSPAFRRGAALLLTGGCLAGCASAVDETNWTMFADPGKYRYHNCEQIAAAIAATTARQQELKALMDKADQSAGGPVVNTFVYKADYVATGEELKVLASTARSKNCNAPASPQAAAAPPSVPASASPSRKSDAAIR